MIEKKVFIKLMTELMAVKKDEDALNEAFKKFEPEFNRIGFYRYEGLVVNALEASMNDKDQWISYFLYERSGQFTTKHIIRDKHGKNLPFRNMRDLYNLIVTN